MSGRFARLRRRCNYEKNVPRCATCREFRPHRMVLVNSLPRYQQPVCALHGFTVQPTACCDDWWDPKNNIGLDTAATAAGAADQSRRPYGIGDVVRVHRYGEAVIDEAVIDAVEVDEDGSYRYSTTAIAWCGHADLKLVRECDEASIRELLRVRREEQDG